MLTSDRTMWKDKITVEPLSDQGQRTLTFSRKLDGKMMLEPLPEEMEYTGIKEGTRQGDDT